MPKKFKAKAIDIEQEITNQIIDLMEKEGTNWTQPWANAARTYGVPRNAISGHEYTGINYIVTLCQAAKNGWNDNRWMTAKQIFSVNGDIKGEKGTKIVFWKPITKKDKDGEDYTFMIAKAFTVFNICQVKNLPEKFDEKVAAIAVPEWSYEDADKFVQNAGVKLSHQGNTAAYNPVADRVFMPEHGQFKSRDGYVSTLFHETAHWTGHKDRLDRKLNTDFQTVHYAKEELIAELSSAFLCVDWGVDAMVQHAGYIKGWIKALKNDKKMIVQAASKASKVKAYLNEQAQAVQKAA